MKEKTRTASVRVFWQWVKEVHRFASKMITSAKRIIPRESPIQVHRGVTERARSKKPRSVLKMLKVV